jgi:LysR family transcriptional regulator, glycine cleavage system transcriptional activator
MIFTDFMSKMNDRADVRIAAWGAGPVISRRFLPSMSLLTAFEAAARHQSFTTAANELSLTQSAVSRQVRSLEEMLGFDLFLREKQTVRLTVAGSAYAEEIRQALQQISNATIGVRANPGGGTLNLAILPTFGTRWLAPRLPGFMSEHPGITINLSTHLVPFDFEQNTADAAIHFGKPDWSNAKMAFLMGETIAPACSPGLAETCGIRVAADLLCSPLLHLGSRPDAWDKWFAAQGLTTERSPGMLIDQFATAAQAAVAGLGVALLPRFLIEAELARGDLIEPVDGPMISVGAYYLAWPARRSDYPPLRSFREWLIRITEDTRPPQQHQQP